MLSSAPVEIDPEDLPALQLDWETDEQHEIDLAKETGKRRRGLRYEIERKYPFLNEKQVELVGTLDEAIDNSIPRVNLPRLKIDNLEKELSKNEFWGLLKLPAITFCLTVPFAAMVIVLENATLGKFYPFLVTMIAFCASVPSIVLRYNEYFDKITTGMDAGKKHVDPALDNLQQRVTNLVVLARKKLNQFLVNVKKEIRALGNKLVAAALPQIRNLEGYLDDSEKSVRGSIKDARKEVDLNMFVPWALQTKQHYHIAVIIPVVSVMLLIQLFGTWRTGEFLEPIPDEGNKWEPVILSTQTFVIAVAQISFSYIVTRKERIVRYVNRKIRRMNMKVNNFLHDKAAKVFHSILDLAMNAVRVQVLQLVTELRRIERLLVATNGKAHAAELKASQATGTALALESSLYDATNIETRHASTVLQKVTDFLHVVAEKLDEATAGLIDCTGFVQTSDYEPPATQKTT